MNTIIVAGVGYRGCNTDGAGLVRDLTANLGWELGGARTLVLGAGGAVLGVLGPLIDAGCAGLTIANRTRETARALAARFGVAESSLGDVGTGWDVIVNGTSAGLAGVGGLVPGEAVAGSRCYDLFYALDGRTLFGEWAAEHGAQAVSDGLGMLVEQAAEAFTLWRGVRPDTWGVVESLRTDAAP